LAFATTNAGVAPVLFSKSTGAALRVGVFAGLPGNIAKL